VKVAAYQRRGVHTRKNRRLARGALGQAFNSEARIGDGHPSIEREARIFSLKDREELRVQAIERIMSAARAQANAINEYQ